MKNQFAERMKWLKESLLPSGKVDLGEGKVLASLARLSVPSIAMVLFYNLFNLVDTIFISWLGENHMVAISYTFPVQIGVFAVLEGVGNGVTALVGRHLGEGKHESACATARAGMAFAYTLCLLWIPFLFPPASDAFFTMLGASDPETLRQAWLYNMWTPIMLGPISFSYVVNSIFRCQGDTVTPFYFFVIANGLNFILDPIFIFVFGWGMTGAAAATFMGRFVGIFFLIKRMRESSSIQIRFFTMPKRYMLPSWGRIAAIGFPVTLSTGSAALGMGSVNKLLSVTYGNAAIAGWMTSLRIEDLAFGTIMGIHNALVPFLAFNFGRQNLERIKQGIKSAFIISGCTTMIFCVLLAAWPWPFINMFNPSDEVADVAAMSLRITMAGYPFAIYSVLYNAFFIATGHTIYSLVIQMSRSIVLRIPAAFLFASIGSARSVWAFQPFSFCGAALLTFLCSRMLFRKLRRMFSRQ